MNLGFKATDILLPNKEIDPYKWSVVACDQYTSQPEYWDQVTEIVGEAPSTLKMIFPEAYLEKGDAEKRHELIQQSMDEYLKEKLFTEYKNAMVYVERTDSSGNVRAGIVGAMDLMEYDFRKGSSSLTRATEATVIERIPPRVKVRQSAKLELPHIMILIDDKEKTVIEPMADKDLELVYDFDLMMDGGHLRGYLLKEEEQNEVLKALAHLGSKEVFEEKYGVKDMPVLLYAMGDGNHSLATAKEYYEQLRKANPEKDLSNHPARYALAEIVNLHSPALNFEAIHRIVTDVDPDALLKDLTEELGIRPFVEGEDRNNKQIMRIVRKGLKEEVVVTKPCSKLTLGSLQNFLDRYLELHGGKIDYIHGDDVLLKLSMQENSIGFHMNDMKKKKLFPTVIFDGALPRKTFSMGHAQDKRFYMECRKITE